MYIDPAAGSLVLQVLIAGLVSAFATISRLRNAVVGFFRSLVTRRRTG
jgi:hypothetical protein